MKNVLILHGLGGSPKLNWYPYLKTELEKNEFQVVIPQLPEADKPNLNLTYQQLTNQMKFDEDTILVGHSSGASLGLGILQKLPKGTNFKKSIFVAGFIDPFLTDELHTYVPRQNYNNLFPTSWDWEKIKHNCKKFVIFHSQNDPYVQMRHAKVLKERLDGELILVPNGAHFSVNSGGERFKEFPELLPYLFD